MRSNRAYNEDELGVMTRVVTATRAVATDILRGFLVLTRVLVEVVIVRWQRITVVTRKLSSVSFNYETNGRKLFLLVYIREEEVT